MRSTWVSAVFLVGLLSACRGATPTPRVSTATSIEVHETGNPPPSEGSTIAVRIAARTVDFEITTIAGDHRQALDVWIADPTYRAALEELCASASGEEAPAVSDDDSFEAEAARWHKEKLAEVVRSCAKDAAFVHSVVDLTPDGAGHLRGSVPWLGHVRLGSAMVGSLLVSARLVSRPEESALVLEEVRDVALEDGPRELDASAFVTDHASTELFSVDGVLLPTADGRYARSEPIEESYGPFTPMIMTGWREAVVLASDKGGASVRAYDHVVTVRLPSAHATIDVERELSRSGLDDVSILDVTTRGDKTWILLSVATMTRGRPTGGMCGAGQEVDWVWLAFEKGTLLKKTFENVESCARTVVSERTAPEPQPVIVLERTSFSDNERTDCVRYDRAHPEQGIATVACKHRPKPT